LSEMLTSTTPYPLLNKGGEFGFPSSVEEGVGGV
jgi:hypothetical protein